MIANRKRVARACDHCSVSRIRCDGDAPCGRCSASRLECRYTRQVKKRGRRSNASKIAALSQDIIPELGPDQRRPNHSTSMETNNSNDSATTILSTSPLVYPAETQPMLSDLVGNADGSLFGRLQCSPGRLDMGNEERVDTLTEFDHDRFDHEKHWLPSLDSHRPVVPVVSVPSGTSVSSECPQRFLPSYYLCLEPLLPALEGFLTANDACELLDIYFSEDNDCFTSGKCPYVLTPVLRKKSLLHPTQPRPTSPALVATMLWAVAQTAETCLYYEPGKRDRITNRLCSLALSHYRLRDIDNWHRVPGGWQMEEDCTVGVAEGDHRNKGQRTFNQGPNPTVDDLLTVTLLTIVISGGQFKADCLKWWHKTVSLVKFLGCHNESRISEAVNQLNSPLEAEEELRRAFWLVYALDRHLALSHNRPLHIPDAECRVLTPLNEELWQGLDTVSKESIPSRTVKPPTTISGPGFFEYFLPLMTLLGDIIDLRLLRHHPRLKVSDEKLISTILHCLRECEASLKLLRDNYASTGFSSHPHTPGRRTDIVIPYAVYIIKVLYVLLHGEWDAIIMLDNKDDWIGSASFSKCASNSIDAAQSIKDILRVDSELLFMPYLLGIYLFHGSFILLLFAERMPQVGPNESVEQACEVIIRAHEVSIVTLSTEFQRTYRKAFRMLLHTVRRPELIHRNFSSLSREVISMYRWTMGQKGLCL